MSEIASIELKQCRICKRMFAETREYFPIRAGSGLLRSECRVCHNTLARDREKLRRAMKQGDGQPEEATPTIEIGQSGYLTLRALVTRLGISREKALQDIHRGFLRSVKAYGASGPSGFKYLISQEDVAKYADYCVHGKASLFLSDACGCCGTTKGNILGDINESSQEVYGYLCSQCYRLIRELRADAERLRSAYEYLLRTRPPQKKKHSS